MDEATLYKNPLCGCCDEYARHLEEQAVDVTIVDDVELSEIKQQAGVPYGLGSCQTIEIGEYWIEGHEPMEAATKLFEVKPDVVALAQQGCSLVRQVCQGYEVYVFIDQQYAPFMTME